MPLWRFPLRLNEYWQKAIDAPLDMDQAAFAVAFSPRTNHLALDTIIYAAQQRFILLYLPGRM